MRRLDGVGAAVFLTTVLFGSAAAGGEKRRATDIVTASSPAGVSARRAIEAAVALLPRAPKRVAVMDVTDAKPEVRDHLRRLDAFTVAGNSVIYIVGSSELLRGAQAGSAFHRAALSAVIWHEMAHLDGADERAARKAESKLWTSFVRDGLLDHLTALRYLEALEKRPDHTLLASR